MREIQPLRCIIADAAQKDHVPLAAALGEGAEPAASVVSFDALVDAVREHDPDFVIMDVTLLSPATQAVLEAWSGRKRPALITCSADERLALRAFEIGAIDYLLKPLCSDRAAAAVRKVRTYLRGSRSPGYGRVTQALEQAVVRRQKDRRICVRSRGKLVWLHMDTIEWISIEGQLASLHCETRGAALVVDVDALRRCLDPRSFAQVSAGAIVSLRGVAEVHNWSCGEHLVVMRSGVRIVSTNEFSEGVRRILGDTATH